MPSFVHVEGHFSNLRVTGAVHVKDPENGEPKSRRFENSIRRAPSGRPPFEGLAIVGRRVENLPMTFPSHLKPASAPMTRRWRCVWPKASSSTASSTVDQLDRYVRWWREGHLSSNEPEQW
jgi:hypothetical protein